MERVTIYSAEGLEFFNRVVESVDAKGPRHLVLQQDGRAISVLVADGHTAVVETVDEQAPT